MIPRSPSSPGGPSSRAGRRARAPASGATPATRSGGRRSSQLPEASSARLMAMWAVSRWRSSAPAWAWAPCSSA
eukprot:8189592-Alexandrium_andersonii.AAC.1